MFINGQSKNPQAEYFACLFYLLIILRFFLKWTTSNVFTEFVTKSLLLFMFSFFFWPQGMWDLSTPPTLEGKVSISGPPGKSQEFCLKSTWERKERGWHDVRGKGLHGDFHNQRLERKSGRRRKNLHEPEKKRKSPEGRVGKVKSTSVWDESVTPIDGSWKRGVINYCWRQVL